MVQALSMDMQMRMVRAVEGGMSRNAAAKRFAVAASTAIKLMQRVKATGSAAPKKIGGYRKHKLEADDTRVQELVRATPNATLAELVEALGREGIATSITGLDRCFRRIGWRFRKTLHASEQNRPDVKAARETWRAEQHSLDVDHLLFVDESGFTTNIVRRYGRCPVGQRLQASAPHGHWCATTFIAALCSTGIKAPMTLDGPMDGETCRAWTEQFLAPVIRPDDVVIIDNLPAHKVAGNSPNHRSARRPSALSSTLQS